VPEQVAELCGGEAVTMGKVRFQLFIGWLMISMLYIFAFLALPLIRGEISDHDAMDAAWKTAYIFAPIVSAFGAFYFASDFSAELEDKETIHPRQAKVALLLTASYHVITIGLFTIHVFLAKYSFPDNPADSFIERVSSCHKLLVFLSPLAVSPIGFILKRPDMKSLTSIGEDKPKPAKKRIGRTAKAKQEPIVPVIDKPDGS
jgi:hypothetical protein